MAFEKTEALLVTDRRSFWYPVIFLEEHEVEWEKSIKYLEVQLYRRLRFSEQQQIVTTKAIQCEANLSRLMPNISGPREAKRRLVTNVMHLKLLYTLSVRASALNYHTIQKKLSPAQRSVALRIFSAYRYVYTV